jgi:hypothetical protein
MFRSVLVLQDKRRTLVLLQETHTSTKPDSNVKIFQAKPACHVLNFTLHGRVGLTIYSHGRSTVLNQSSHTCASLTEEGTWSFYEKEPINKWGSGRIA